MSTLREMLHWCETGKVTLFVLLTWTFLLGGHVPVIYCLAASLQ